MDASPNRPQLRQVLVLQGGGALGSYQAGVYEALSAAALAPDWVAGISIGAVNAAIIAGNPPERRLERLRAFWDLTSSGQTALPLTTGDRSRVLFNEMSAAWMAAVGVPGFFRPRFGSPLVYPDGTPEALSFYDTSPLRQTLEELVDFDLINSRRIRFSVGAVNVRTGHLRFFDNHHDHIGPEHILASGALPPGLPPVQIEGEWWWDGGLVSNTPLDHVLDSAPESDMVIFQVDLFSSAGEIPRTIFEAAEREKEIRFASRARCNTEIVVELRKAKAALRNLIAKLPRDLLGDPELEVLETFAHENAVTVVRLVYASRHWETNSKDYEFSRATMREHWAAGLEDATRVAARCARLLHARPGATTLLDSRTIDSQPAPQGGHP